MPLKCKQTKQNSLCEAGAVNVKQNMHGGGSKTMPISGSFIVFKIHLFLHIRLK